jgi:hypothetical protein
MLFPFFLRDFPDFVPEAFPCLRRNPPLRFGTARKAKAQEFPLLRFPHRTFSLFTLSLSCVVMKFVMLSITRCPARSLRT